MLQIRPLQPLFAARVTGLDLRQPLDEAEFARVREAFDRFSVLVFPGQDIEDAAQVAFSERFGPLEATRAGANGAGGKLIVLTNIGPDGRIAPPTDKQVLNNRANQSWHHDSSSSRCRRAPPCCRRGRSRPRAATPSSPACARPMRNCRWSSRRRSRA